MPVRPQEDRGASDVQEQLEGVRALLRRALQQLEAIEQPAPSGPPPPALTPDQLAERWRCSRQHIYNMIRAGELRCWRAGRLVRITVAEVLRIEGQDAPAGAAPGDES